MTSFSDAIVNGFQIAAQLRDQKLRERTVQLDEDYRQATLAQRKNEFATESDYRNRALAANVKQGDQLHEYRNRSLAQDAHQFDESVKIDKSRLGLVGRELDMKDRAYNDERFDKRAAAVGAAYSDYAVMGGDERALAVFRAAMADPEVNAQVGERMFGDRNAFASKKDGTPMNQVAYRDGKVVLYGFRKNAEGKLEPAVMDQGRTADNSTPPLEIDARTFMQTVTGIYASNPYFVTEASKGLTVAGLKPKGTPDTLEAVGEATAKAVSQREARATPAAPSGMASPRLAQPPVQEPPPPPRAPTAEEVAAQHEWKNLQRQYVYNRGLGATVSAGDVEAGRVTGVASERLAGLGATNVARQNAADQKRLDEMSSRHNEAMKSLLPAASGDDKYKTEQLRSRATQDASLMTDLVGAQNFAQNPQLESAALTSLAQINQMATGDNDYAEELRNNPELRVSAAWAAVNAGIPMNDPSFQAALEAVGKLSRSQTVSVKDMTQRLMEYYGAHKQDSME